MSNHNKIMQNFVVSMNENPFQFKDQYFGTLKLMRDLKKQKYLSNSLSNLGRKLQKTVHCYQGVGFFKCSVCMLVSHNIYIAPVLLDMSFNPY